METLFPVILPVPGNNQQLTGRDRVKNLSRLARQALLLSGKEKGIDLKLNDFTKDDNNVPLPVAGYRWSVAHKHEYVAGVVAADETGIDIEKFRPCSDALFKKIADMAEWKLSGQGRSEELFFRYWTAKEAVLKTGGRGLKDLSKCKVINIISKTELILNYLKKEWLIEHYYFDDHIAAVVKNHCNIRWIFTGGKLLKNAIIRH